MGKRSAALAAIAMIAMAAALWVEISERKPSPEEARLAAARALQRVQDSQDAALARLRESLDALTLQTERSGRALRRDLEQVRAEVRREREVSGKVRLLLIAALIPLVLHLLFTLRAPERKEPPA